MGDGTGIQWTDATWNPVTGCTKVSAGCKFCYAETVAQRFWKGRKFGDVEMHVERLTQPKRWQRPRRIFVNSMSDLFHEHVSTDFIGRVWSVMREARQHTFQILTKRPKRMADLVRFFGYVPDNVWLGVSVESQDVACERLDALITITGAPVLFVSAEPLLGPLHLTPWMHPECVAPDRKRVGWVIAGGESGRGARFMHPMWARALMRQCQEAGTAFFMKQFGGHPDKRGDMAAFPEDLRVREYPVVG